MQGLRVWVCVLSSMQAFMVWCSFAVQQSACSRSRLNWGCRTEAGAGQGSKQDRAPCNRCAPLLHCSCGGLVTAYTVRHNHCTLCCVSGAEPSQLLQGWSQQAGPSAGMRRLCGALGDPGSQLDLQRGMASAQPCWCCETVGPTDKVTRVKRV